MKDPTPQEQRATALEEARIKLAQLSEAYAVVFGTDKKRTEQQRLVWEDLKRGVDDEYDATFNLSNDKLDGLTLIALGIKRDGAKGIIRLINARISQATTLKQKPKEVAKVKR